jgi:hypothetical protein
MAVAAKDASCPESWSLRVAVVKSVEGTMPDEHADGLAVWTGCLFEAFGDGQPLLLASVKAWWVGHDGRLARGCGVATEDTDGPCSVATVCEVEAGSD